MFSSKVDRALHVLDSKTNACLFYSAFSPYPKFPKFDIDLQVLKSHPEFKLYSDLVDCEVDICSLEVPALFTENFDYQDIRTDFVKGILESDILGKTIYCHLLQQGYAVRVRNPFLYNSISKEVLQRWAYPYTPDGLLLSKKALQRQKGLDIVYKGDKTHIHRTVSLVGPCLIGHHVTIGPNSKIIGSVIGDHCVIGENVTIIGSYLWSKVKVQDGSTIHQSIIGDQVVLKPKTTIQEGCIISNLVVVDGMTIPTNTRLSIKGRNEDALDQVDNPTDYDTHIVGPTGMGFKWSHTPLLDGEPMDPRNVALTGMGRVHFSDSEDNVESESEKEDLSDEEDDDDEDDSELENESNFSFGLINHRCSTRNLGNSGKSYCRKSYNGYCSVRTKYVENGFEYHFWRFKIGCYSSLYSSY
jgi:translation initiation factor eIF-2B subunit epsilon